MVPPGMNPGFPAGPPGAPMLPTPAASSLDIGAAMDPELAHRAWLQQSGFFPPGVDSLGIQSLGEGEPMWQKSPGFGKKIASQLQGAFQKVLDRWSHSGVPGAQWSDSSRAGSRDRSPVPHGPVPMVKGDPMFLAQPAPQHSPWPGAPWDPTQMPLAAPTMDDLRVALNNGPRVQAGGYSAQQLALGQPPMCGGFGPTLPGLEMPQPSSSQQIALYAGGGGEQVPAFGGGVPRPLQPQPQSLGPRLLTVEGSSSTTSSSSSSAPSSSETGV